MTQDDLEQVYEALAVALDDCATDERELYLAKLALALCDTIGAAGPCLAIIDECRTGLARHSQG